MVNLNSIEWKGGRTGKLQERRPERKTEKGNAKFPRWQERKNYEKFNRFCYIIQWEKRCKPLKKGQE